MLDPDGFAVLTWGKKTVGVTAKLDVADAALVRDLVVGAWRRRASQRTVAKLAAASANDRPDDQDQ